ncbi:alpha/beta hydrolase [Roseivivax sp. CAU 1761]
MRALPVFEGRLLRADLFPGGGAGLFVTFRQRLDLPRGFDAPRPVRTFTEAGFAHLHCQARDNDWYVNAETASFAAALADCAAGQPRRIAMGFSMGGYAALRFAAALRLDRAVLVSPQVSIHPETVPWDRRFHAHAEGFDPVAGDLARHGRPALEGVILADPFRRADLRNAQAIRALFPGLALARLAGGGHPASAVLRAGGRFGALQRCLTAPEFDPGRLVRLHRRVRGGVPAYWQELAALAERHGRRPLAARCRDRAAQLARGLDDAPARS